MFSSPTPGTPGGVGFDTTTFVPPLWFNYISTNLGLAVDGFGGGYYQLAGADLRFSSDTRTFKWNSPAAGFPTELRGFVKIGLSDDVNYATGTGTFACEIPATFSSTVAFAGGMTFSGSVTFNNPVTFASGGDITLQSGCAVVAQSGSSITVNSGGTLTVNGTASITNGLTLGGTVTFTTPRTYTVTPSGVAGFVSADWTAILGGTRFQQVAGSSSAVGWIFYVPAGSVITSVSVYVDPNSGHGALPATMPMLQLMELDPATSGSVQIDATSDTTAVIATYEAPHTITSPVLNYTVSAARLILARVYGEYGANSVGDGLFYPPVLTYTRTTFSDI
jgi:hypothetical protein